MLALLSWLSLLIVRVNGYVLNGDVYFSSPQLQILWQDEVALGSTTVFNYPLSMGTASRCDQEVFRLAFDQNFHLFPNYTDWSPDWSFSRRVAALYQQGYSYQYASPDLKIESDILSPPACFMACITLKQFQCREFDYYTADSGVCALYKNSGVYNDYYDDFFVGKNPASDHYKIYPGITKPLPCNLTRDDYAFPHFAMGWKAMEVGWIDLARHQFDKALGLDPDYYMAYIGKVMTYDDMGFGVNNSDMGDTASRLNDISSRQDLHLKMTNQQLLLLESLTLLHNATDLSNGLQAIAELYLLSRVKPDVDYVVRAAAGAAMLIESTQFQLLNSESASSVLALRYLTHNLNPYRRGKNRTDAIAREFAVAAMHTLIDLQVYGAIQINTDCIDIAIYYGEWATGSLIIQSMGSYLYIHLSSAFSPGSLYMDDGGDIVVNGLNVLYMSRSWRYTVESEILHFFSLQLALFNHSIDTLATHQSESIADEAKSSVWQRAVANAYFTMYDYVLDKYATKMKFNADWLSPVNKSTHELALVSRVYYWTAAGVQMLRSGHQSSTASLTTILNMMDVVVDTVTNDKYKTLATLYRTVLQGTQEFIDKKYSNALVSAQLAGLLQSQLGDPSSPDWSLQGVGASEHFRMLVPLGYQFQADMMRWLYLSPAAIEVIGSDLSIDDVLGAYKLAVDTPPLNASRLMKGYGDMLLHAYGNTPKAKGENIPLYVEIYSKMLKTWKDTDITDDQFNAINEMRTAVSLYYNRPFTSCERDAFQFRSESELCWGGYVIIAICTAVVFIIVIVIVVLRLRSKAASRVADDGKAEAFIFSGPLDVTQRDDNSSTLSRSIISDTAFMSQTLDIRRSSAYTSSAISHTDRLYYGGRSHSLGSEAIRKCHKYV